MHKTTKHEKCLARSFITRRYRVNRGKIKDRKARSHRRIMQSISICSVSCIYFISNKKSCNCFALQTKMYKSSWEEYILTYV